MPGRISEKHPSKDDRRNKWIEKIRSVRMRGARPVVERFFEKVRITDGCWLWTGTADKHGYGFFRPYGRKTRPVRSHRFSFELAYGPTPLHVLHRCDTPACVRPSHLFKGTQSDNNADRDAKGRWRDHWKKNRGARLEAAIRRAGLRPSEVARLLGISHQSLHYQLRGGMPRLELREKIAALLQCSVAELWGHRQ